MASKDSKAIYSGVGDSEEEKKKKEEEQYNLEYRRKIMKGFNAFGAGGKGKK